MNGDGDILGTRRRPDTAQSGEILMTAPALPGGGILQQSQPDPAGTAAGAATGAAAGAGGAGRHAPGASPLKRARSVGGGASGIRGGEAEVRMINRRCLHQGGVCGIIAVFCLLVIHHIQYSTRIYRQCVSSAFCFAWALLLLSVYHDLEQTFIFHLTNSDSSE